MPIIPINPDGQTATVILNTYMTDQIIPNCTKIFAGGDIDETFITETRSAFQEVNKLIAQILADMPS